MRKLTIVIEKDEDNYYVAEVLELPGCLTQAKTLSELFERLKEAITLYLEELTEKEIMPSELIK